MESRGERCQAAARHPAECSERDKPGGGVLYRLYLKDEFGAIIGRADFDADEAAQPLAIAATIFQDCSDMAAVYELWQCDVLIVSSKKAMAPDKAANLSDHQRQLIIATETAFMTAIG